MKKIETEIWLDITGYEGYYQVSSFGRVKSLERVVMRSDGRSRIVKECLLSLTSDRNGYRQVALCKYSTRKIYNVHLLVAMAFKNHKPDGTLRLVVNHIDLNKTNNYETNRSIIRNRGISILRKRNINN